MAASESFAVLGGEGFVGNALVTALISKYSQQQVASLGLTQRTFNPGYRFFRTDICSHESLAAAFKNCGASTVFHTVSPHHNASAAACEAVNVKGTEAIIEACILAGVKKLIFTSSATVCYEGVSLINCDERLPFAEQEEDPYAATKRKAEQLIIEANGRHGLLTCSLRFSGIFGPGDRQVIPGILKVLHSKQTPFQIGNNLNLFDWCHIKNVVHSHILAAERLGGLPVPASDFDFRILPVNCTVKRRNLPTSQNEDVSVLPDSKSFPKESLLPADRTRFDQFQGLSETQGVAGQTFFISNGEPIAFWTFVKAIWFAYNGHVPPFTFRISPSLGMMFASLSEAWIWLRGQSLDDAAITKAHVRYVLGDMYFNIEKARRILGYEPVHSLEEGIKDAVEWVKQEEAKAKAFKS